MAGTTYKLGADVKQFTTAMNQSKAALKQLDAELKLNKAQAEAGGNAEQLMAQKVEILRKEIAEQSKVVETAEKALKSMQAQGVEPTNKAYVQMKTNLTNAKTALTQMKTQLTTVSKGEKEVADAASEASSETKSFADSLKSIGQGVSFASVKSGIQGITSTAQTAFNAIKSLATGFWNLETEAATWADDTATTAQQYGIDATLYRKMSSTEAESLTDVSASDVLSAMDILASKAENGLYTFDNGANMQMTGDRLTDLFNVLQRAQQLYGSGDAYDTWMQSTFGNKKFRKISNLDVQSYTELLDTVDVLDEDKADDLITFSDAVAEMNQSFETFKQTIAADLAGPASQIADAIGGLLDRLTEWANTEEGEAALEGLGNAISSIFESITADDLTSVVDKATYAIEQVSGAMQWFGDHQDDVKTWMDVIAKAFIGLEAIKVSTSVLQLVTGLGGITGGASAISSLAGALGNLGTVSLIIGSAYIVAKNIDDWTADAYESIKNSDMDEGLKSFLLGWTETAEQTLTGKSASDNALTRELESNTAAASHGTDGYYIIDSKTGAVTPFTGTPKASATSDTEVSYGGVSQGAYENATAWLNSLSDQDRQLLMKYTSGLMSEAEYEAESLQLQSAAEEAKALVAAFEQGLADEEMLSQIHLMGRTFAQACADGFASGMGGTSGTTNNNSTYINTVNIDGAYNPSAMYRALQKQGLQANGNVGG